MEQNNKMSEDSNLLLNQFESILDSDPLIDELAFIHPTQFAILNEEVENSLNSSKDARPNSKDDNLRPEMQCVGAMDLKDSNFWYSEHKLGVSAQILLPLYKAAKDAFFHAIRKYRRVEALECEGVSSGLSSLCGSLESEVLKHSKALLLLSSDFMTAWNSRKFIVSKKQNISAFLDELYLSALVLSYSPKSDQAWCHRRWVIKIIAENCSTLHEIVVKESELAEKLAERSKMNYRAWNHRCWLVSYMTKEQVLQELKSRNWAQMHVADNSCFHYRTRLLLRISKAFSHKPEDEASNENVDVCQIWKEELDWNKVLIKQYIGREALWLHRRFLSVYWINHFTTVLCETETDRFLDNELHLLSSCSSIPDNEFEDFEAQALHSATYVLWIKQRIPEPWRIRLQEKMLCVQNLKAVLSMAHPGRS